VAEPDRLAQLRALAIVLERRPLSKARDHLLMETRRRIVDLDTGGAAGTSAWDGPFPADEHAAALGAIARELRAPGRLTSLE